MRKYKEKLKKYFEAMDKEDLSLEDMMIYLKSEKEGGVLQMPICQAGIVHDMSLIPDDKLESFSESLQAKMDCVTDYRTHGGTELSDKDIYIMFFY